tara:strand:- start:218 stop:409 length:192 start_codon:yes stop_codon:yes gene_type:complete
MEFLETLQALNWAGIFQAAISVIGAFSVIATMTPNKSDNIISDFLLRCVNILGGNIKNASNRE